MKRLLEGDGTELEQDLLGALRHERPSPELEQRMRAAIGLGPIAVTVPPPPVAPAAKTFGTWGAIAAGSVVAAVVITGGVLLGRGGASGDSPPSAPAADVVTPSERPEPAPTPAVTPEPKAPEAAPAAPAPQHVAPSSGKLPASASLREEIRLIDSARVAVKSEDGVRALAILDQYARRFPKGTFREEARVLRAEALKHR